MKYLKLFENFDGEDPKWIVTSALDPIEVNEILFFDDRPNHQLRYKDTSMFRLFKFSEEPSEDKLNHLKSWLEDEGYYSCIKPSGTGESRIVVTDKPIKEACSEWLNKNYSNLEKVESKIYIIGDVIYRYGPGDNIFCHKKQLNEVWVSYYKIWSFFENYFDMYDSEIQTLFCDFLSEKYNLRGVKVYRESSNGLSEFIPRSMKDEDLQVIHKDK